MNRRQYLTGIASVGSVGVMGAFGSQTGIGVLNTICGSDKYEWNARLKQVGDEFVTVAFDGFSSVEVSWETQQNRVYGTFSVSKSACGGQIKETYEFPTVVSESTDEIVLFLNMESLEQDVMFGRLFDTGEEWAVAEVTDAS